MDKPLTTAETKDLFEQMPEWLEAARESMTKQRVEVTGAGAKKDGDPGRVAAGAARNAEK